MFCRMFMACVCLGTLYGVEGDVSTIPNSHLSFIFKEKQKENAIIRPKWDFLSELTEEDMGPFSLFQAPLFASAGSTGPAPTDIDTPLSLSAPNTNIAASMQNASGITTFVKSHQNILSTLFNPSILGNKAEGQGITFDREELDESQYIAQANADDNQSPPFFGKDRKQNQHPYGKTRILGHGSNKNDLWIDFFGEKLKFLPNSGFNTVYDTCLGFLVGYDRFMSSEMITGAIGYNHCKTTVAGHVGHGHENQIFGVFQGTVYLPKRMYLGYGVYGSVNLNDFHRFVNTGTAVEVAKSSFTSYTFGPHIDFGYDWCVNDWFIVEPFISNNFFFNFQPSYSEDGASGYNESQDALNSGLYVLKPGVNFYQRLSGNWGLLVLRQEVGYERFQPMFGTENTASIIDVQNGILTPTGLRDLNLFIFEFQVFARTNHGFYGDVLYQGRWGTGLISNALHLKVGHFF